MSGSPLRGEQNTVLMVRSHFVLAHESIST